MSAPSTVLTNGVTQPSIGGITAVADETFTSGTVVTTIFAVEDFSFEPKRVHKDTLDADEAIVMRKSTTPMAAITLKGKVKTLGSTGIITQEPGTSITTTISGGALAVANFAGAINAFTPTDGLIILESIKFSRKRLQPALDADLALAHLPHAA